MSTSGDVTKTEDYRTAWQDFPLTPTPQPPQLPQTEDQPKPARNQSGDTGKSSNGRSGRARIKFQSPEEQRRISRPQERADKNGIKLEVSPCSAVLAQGQAKIRAVDSKLNKLRDKITGIKTEILVGEDEMVKQGKNRIPGSSPDVGRSCREAVRKGSPRLTPKQISPRKTGATAIPTLKQPNTKSPTAPSKASLKYKKLAQTCNSSSPRKPSPANGKPGASSNVQRRRRDVSHFQEATAHPSRRKMSPIPAQVNSNVRAKIAVRQAPERRVRTKAPPKRSSPNRTQTNTDLQKPHALEDPVADYQDFADSHFCLCEYCLHRREQRAKAQDKRLPPHELNPENAGVQNNTGMNENSDCQCSDCQMEQRQSAKANNDTSEQDTADQSVMNTASLNCEDATYPVAPHTSPVSGHNDCRINARSRPGQCGDRFGDSRNRPAHSNSHRDSGSNCVIHPSRCTDHHQKASVYRDQNLGRYDGNPVYKDSWCQWEDADLPLIEPQNRVQDNFEMLHSVNHRLPPGSNKRHSRGDTLISRINRRPSINNDGHHNNHQRSDDDDYGREDCQVMMLTPAAECLGCQHGMGDFVRPTKEQQLHKMGMGE